MDLKNTRLRSGKEGFPFGYTAIAELDGMHKDMLMDFGVLRLAEGQKYEECYDLECAYLLVKGKVRILWQDQSAVAERSNCFDMGPWVLSVPAGVKVAFEGVGPDSEIVIQRTPNEVQFPAKLYAPEDTPDEIRGSGTMKETCTRCVRTVLDYTLSPWSKFVLGEVINTPGRWSSYPPHIHPQPEIYYYKMFPQDGYGFAEYGEDVYKVYDSDTVFIEPDYTHPQVATPGHAFWYLWVIRHLDDEPYKGPQWPHFLEQYDYLRTKDLPIWPDIPAEKQ